MYRGRPWTIRQYAGFASAEETNAALPLPARARTDGAVGRLRPADAARLRLRRSARRRRSRAHRRRDRLDRRHGAAVRRDPARRGLDVDDDQRARRAAAAAVRARRRGAGRLRRAAARHGAERHPQGVHRARELHLPAAAVDAHHDRSVRVLRRAHPEAGTRSRSPGTTSARRARPRCRSSRSRSRTGSRTRRPRSRQGCRRTSSASGCRSSSTRTTTSSRRWRSSARRGGCGRGSCASASASTNPKAQALRFHAQTGGSTLTAQQPENNVVRVAIQALSAVVRRCAVDPHERLRRGARAADRAAARTSRCARSSCSRTRRAGPTPPIRSAARTSSRRSRTSSRRRRWELIERIDELGGAVAAVEQGFVQGEIEQAAFRWQQEVEGGERVIVGVNRFTEGEEEPIELPPPRSRGGAASARADRARAGRSGTREEAETGTRGGARGGARRRRTCSSRCARRCAARARSARSATRCATSSACTTRSG